MDRLNEAFKGLAEKIKLPEFFKNKTLIFNNLFLVLVAVVLLIALLLVIFLVPSKKKVKSGAEEKIEKTEEDKSEAEAEEETLVEEEPVKEEPVEEVKEEAVLVEETPAEEPAATVIEEPAEEKAEEAPAAEEPVEEEKAEEPVEAAPVAEAAPAEEKKAATKPAPKEDAAAKSSGKYEIVKKNGSFYFLLKANNGQLLLESSAYTTEAGVKKAIETFKNAVEIGEFKIDEDKNGNFKFILRANARSQMLYHGETYGSRQSAESAIGSVKNFALRAVIKRAEDQDEDDGTVGAAFVETAPLKASDHKQGGKYEIEERHGSYYFLLKANNGQLLLESPAFTTEQGAKNGIDSFKKAAESGVYSIDEDKNGNFRFILKASARAQMRYFGESYSTRQSAEKSVNSVRAFAQNAILK